jgi:hypothetical protein
MPRFSALYDAIHGWMDGWMGHVKKLHKKRPQCPIVFGLTHMFWAPIQMVKREKQMQHLRQRDKGCCFYALKKKEIGKDDEESPFDTCLEKGISAYILWKRIGK